MQEACKKMNKLVLLRGHSIRRYDGRWEDIEFHSGGWASPRTDPKGWSSEVEDVVRLHKSGVGVVLCRVLDGSQLYRVYYCDDRKHYHTSIAQGSFYECIKQTKEFASQNNLLDDMRCQIEEFYKTRIC